MMEIGDSSPGAVVEAVIPSGAKAMTVSEPIAQTTSAAS